jgi:outer membrane receptor protein involved in Fe transport
MNKTIAFAISTALGIVPLLATGADDIATLRNQLEQLKHDYEHRIHALEQALQQAHSAQQAPPESTTAPQSASKPLPVGGSVTSGNAFNPAISVIMDGVYYHDDKRGAGNTLLQQLDGIHHAHGADHDHDHGHSHSMLEQGLNLRSIELAISATVDPYFDARAQIVFNEEGVEVEEAYFVTRSLPAGLRLKGGKFLSAIGYANDQHPHQWDFVDQNLPYQTLLGDHGLSDSGVQLNWLPGWDLYTLVGMELFQGRNEKMGARVDTYHYDFEEEEYDIPFKAHKNGPRLWSTFAKIAPDLGYHHALQGGVFYVHSRQLQELHGDDPYSAGDQTHALEGTSWLFGSDWVYKYDSAGAYGQGDFRMQAEYIYQVKDLDVIYHAAFPEVVGQMRQFSQDGLYLQGVYGVAPRWEAGVRYEIVGLTNQLKTPSTLRSWESSDRWGLMLAFRPTEYSVVRAQFSHSNYHRDNIKESAQQFWLQYQMSLGVHGAHAF